MQDQSQQVLKFKQEFLEFVELFLWSLRSFTWVSWWYLPSTHHADLTSVVFFLLSFVASYSLNVTIHFFVLTFSDPTSLLFSVFLLLCSTFPIFYFLPFSSACLSLHILNFLFLSFLSVFYFLSCCLLSFSSNFLCLPSNFSFCFYLFLCLLLSFFAFFYFHYLPVFYSVPLTPYSSFYPFLHIFSIFKKQMHDVMNVLWKAVFRIEM